MEYKKVAEHCTSSTVTRRDTQTGKSCDKKSQHFGFVFNFTQFYASQILGRDIEISARRGDCRIAIKIRFSSDDGIDARAIKLHRFFLSRSPTTNFKLFTLATFFFCLQSQLLSSAIYSHVPLKLQLDTELFLFLFLTFNQHGSN